jgi:ATP-binding cassette subfamily B protein
VDHGRIVERGTHRELLAAKGAYYELYMMQYKSQEGRGNAALGELATA